MVGDLRAGRVGSLTISYFASAGATWIPPVVATLVREFPQLRLDLRLFELAGDDPVDPDVEIFVEGAVDRGAGGRVIELLHEPYVVVLPTGHPLADRAEIPLAELRDEHWVDNDFSRGPCRQVVLDACAAAGFTPAFPIETHDYPSAIAFVAAGVGITVLPRLGHRDAAARGARGAGGRSGAAAADHAAGPGRGARASRGGPGRRAAAGRRPASRLSQRAARPDVVRVVHQVVREVLDQRLDGEHRAVRAPARPGPLLAGDARAMVAPIRAPAARQLGGDLRRPLPPVLPLQRRGVLVPVGEQRVRLGEHRAQPAVEHVADVAHVAGVLGGRPDLRGRPGGGVRRRRAAAVNRATTSSTIRGTVGGRGAAGVEAAVRARAGAMSRSSPCRPVPGSTGSVMSRVSPVRPGPWVMLRPRGTRRRAARGARP